MSSKPASSSKLYARQFLQFFAASLKNLRGAILNNAHAAFILAKLTASAGAFIWNYLANLSWTFREARPRVSGLES